MSPNKPGITRIEGIITNFDKVENAKRFDILLSNGTSREYIVPPGMQHMTQGVKNGVSVIIEDTLSGPKSIITYAVIAQDSDEQVADIKGEAETV